MENKLEVKVAVIEEQQLAQNKRLDKLEKNEDDVLKKSEIKLFYVVICVFLSVFYWIENKNLKNIERLLQENKTIYLQKENKK